MSRLSLPPRGIFVPTQIIFHPQLPSAVLVTWLKLRSLAWDRWDTPPLSIPELASLTGIHPARLHRHLAQLQGVSALSWHTSNQGKVIVSFPQLPATEPEHRYESVGDIAPPISPNRFLESDINASYFPARILGYLSYDDEDEPFVDHDGPPSFYRPTSEVQRQFILTQDCLSDQGKY